MLFYGLPVSLLLYSASNIIQVTINDVLLEHSSFFKNTFLKLCSQSNMIVMKIWVQLFKAVNTRWSNREEQCAQLQTL